MNKIYKLFILVLFAFCINCSFLPINAENNKNTDVYTIEKDNKVYEFDSYQSYCKFQQDNNSNSWGKRTSSGTDYVSTQIWSEIKYYQWIGYHSLTPNWSTASSYTLINSKTYSASGSVESHGYTIGVTVSYSQSATVTYPANSSRFSKLGVYADVRASRYKYDVYEYGTYSYTYYVNVATPLEKYITVVYKS